MSQEHRTAAEVKVIAKHSRKAQLEQRFVEAWYRLFPRLPRPQMQYKFHPKRQWKFDFAWDDLGTMIAVEIDGGSFVNGGHNRPVQQAKDYEKSREAVKLGWRVLRYNTIDMKDAEAVATEVAEMITNAK